MSVKEIQGFKAIPVQFLKDCTSCHELFIKEHSLRHQEESKPAGRTLFVLNIPPYATEDSLKNLFSSSGKVTTVLLQHSINELDEGSGFKVGYIVFAKREGLLKALQKNNFSCGDLPFKTGIDKWVQEYNNSICNPDMLLSEINSFMTKFEKHEEENKKRNKEVPDEGWTVVTKKGRNPGFSRKESVEIKINEKMKTGAKKKELKNFYTFQIRESKMKNLGALRKNFEEAKKKVAIMKGSRRFKPY